MPDVLEFASQHMAGLHGQVGMLALDGLHASQLIHANAAFTLLSALRSLRIHFTSLHNFFVSARICNLG